MPPTPCLATSGNLEALSSSTWQDKPSLGEILRSPATVSIEANGKKEEFGNVGVSVGPSGDPRSLGYPVISMFGLNLAGGHLQLPVLLVQPELFHGPTNLVVDGFGVIGVL